MPPDDGSMAKDKREASLEKIRNSKTTRCILISFKAGSTGEFRGRLRLPLSFRHFPCLPGAIVASEVSCVSAFRDHGSYKEPWLVFPRSLFRLFFGNFPVFICSLNLVFLVLMSFYLEPSLSTTAYTDRVMCVPIPLYTRLFGCGGLR